VHNFGTCIWRTEAQWRLPEKKRVSTQEKSDFVIPLHHGKIRFFLRQNMFFFRIFPSRICSPSASTEVVHRPRSQSPLHFVIRNIKQIRTKNQLPVASRTTFAPSHSALADRSDLPVMLITRMSKADKKNQRGRSLSICRTQ